jgi:hypothetical protein
VPRDRHRERGGITYVHFCTFLREQVTALCVLYLVAAYARVHQRGSAAVPEAPMVLVVEDEYLLHAPLEEALVTGGFKPVFVGSGPA